MDYNIFKKTQLAAAVSMVVGAATISPVYAQDNAADNTLEEVIVTGIRGSLQASMDIKRDAQGVVDAISAEDIGKMPDTNLAESLQRITGVSIDRQNGEGSRVTVRGFGPDFNVVTLNGRQMPAANVEGTTASASRSFDFASLAAESVSGVEVFKTARANLSTGGIGSVINIKTARPLDSEELILNIGAKALMDTSNENGSDVTPELSGIYSQTFADGMFGVAITGSYAERDSGYNLAETPGGWYTIPGGQGDWGSIAPDDETYVNPPQVGDVYAVPRNISYGFNQIQRKRTNGQLTLQFAPNDDVQATLDYTYSELDQERQVHGLGAWFNGDIAGGSGGEFTPGTGAGIVVAPVVYSDGSGADITMSAGEWGTINTNRSVGLNVEWQATERLSFTFDHHSSSAENGAKDERGTNNVITGAQFARDATVVDYSQELPVFHYVYIDGMSLDSSEFVTSGTTFRNSYMLHEIDQTQIHGVFEFDEGIIKSIDFGLTSVDSTNRSAYSNAERGTWGGYGTAADYDDSIWTLKSVADKFDQMSGHNNPALEPYYYESDFEGMRSAIAAIAEAEGTEISPCGYVLCTDPVFSTDRTTNEKQKAAYVQANLAWESGGMPMAVSAGLRYEDTQIEASTVLPIPVSVFWEADNEFKITTEGEGSLAETGEYALLLPNLDFQVEITEDILARASIGKTISRPGWTDIQGGRSLNTTVRATGGTGSAGNPDLDPFESTNIDLSGEWYYSEGSYVSLGYYNKSVENFIGTDSFVENVPGLTHPGRGPRWEAAVEAVGSEDPALVREEMENQHGAPVVGDSTDPLVDFTIVRPVNAKTGNIDGFEFAVQHMFGDTGFGGIFNITTVSGDISYDNMNTNKGEGVENQFALLGLSDSMNLIGFYDKNGLQARIAYNWRDEFLSGTFDGNGERNPVYVDAFGQFDINVSYEINDNISVFAEGINVTSEISRSHGRHDNMVIGVAQAGPRYALGARYTF